MARVETWSRIAFGQLAEPRHGKVHQARFAGLAHLVALGAGLHSGGIFQRGRERVGDAWFQSVPLGGARIQEHHCAPAEGEGDMCATFSIAGSAPLPATREMPPSRDLHPGAAPGRR